MGRRFYLYSIVISLCLASSSVGQTGSIFVDENHNGHKIFGLPTPTAGNEAATKAYADSLGGGGGSGTVTSITATAPIVVTPSPLVATGVISLTGTSYGLGFLPLADAAAARTYIGALGSASIDNTAYASAWAGFSTIAPSKKAVYDEIHSFTAAHDGFVNVLDQIGGITNTNAFGVIQAPKVIGTDIQAWDADLDALAALTGTNTIYYRSAANTWSPVTIGGNMTFSGGTLNSTAGGSGTVTTTGSPATGNLSKFSGATSITNGDLSGDVTTSGTLAATIANSAVTYAKMQNVSANSKLLGSSATGSGAAPSEITVGSGLTMTASTLSASGGTGNVSNTGTPVNNQLAVWTNATTIEGDSTLTYGGGATGVLTIGGTDVGLARNAAGILEINNGTFNTFTGAGLKTSTVNATTGYQVNGGAIAGKILIGNGTNFVASTPTYPNASATQGKLLQSDSTNFIASSSTWPTAPGSTGKIVISDNTNFVNSSVGYPNSANPTSGTIIISNGTNWVASTPVFPNAAGTTGVIVQSNGTNFITSTATWPTTNTAGYLVRGDGTNYAAYPAQIINSSIASQSPSTSDVYLTGSNVVVAAGDFKAKGQYRCIFDMTKSAGTGAIVLTVRVGTLGTTGDAAILTFTFGAGTSVADTGTFDVLVNWRSVGSGTSAVIQGVCRAAHNLATTGLFNNAAAFVVIGSPSPSSGFASNTATNIGISFNGSTAFAGTTTLVQASLQQ